MNDSGQQNTEQLTAQIVVGILLAAICVFVLLWIIPRHVSSAIGEIDVGPSFFPTLSASALFVLCVVYVGLKIPGLFGPTGFGLDFRTIWKIVLQALSWMVVGALAYIGMSQVHFGVTAATLITIGALTCRYHNWPFVFGLAIAMPFLIYQMAWFIFSVQLP